MIGCFCFHQLLDKSSVMTFRAVTNLITGEGENLETTYMTLNQGMVKKKKWYISTMEYYLWIIHI